MMNEALNCADELKRLYANERTAMVDFLLALVEFDRRRLYLELGFSSLWKFCLEGLHLGEGATNLRTRAVGLLQRFPSLEQPVRDGRLTLSTLCEIGKVLSEDNVHELVVRAAWKTREEAEEIVASLRPKHAVSEGLFQLPPTAMMSRPVAHIVEDESHAGAPAQPSTPAPRFGDSVAVSCSRLEGNARKDPRGPVPRCEHRRNGVGRCALRDGRGVHRKGREAARQEGRRAEEATAQAEGRRHDSSGGSATRLGAR